MWYWKKHWRYWVKNKGRYNIGAIPVIILNRSRLSSTHGISRTEVGIFYLLRIIKAVKKIDSFYA